jgi:hypothetical protein
MRLPYGKLGNYLGRPEASQGPFGRDRHDFNPGPPPRPRLCRSARHVARIGETNGNEQNVGMIWGRKERQIRCLYYCFVEISDWGLRQLKTARDDMIEERGRGGTPDYLLNVERDWGVQVERLYPAFPR